MNAVLQETSLLEQALSHESLRRKTERHKLEFSRTLVDGVVSKLHSSFLLDRDAIASLKLVGDYGTTVTLEEVQPKPWAGRDDLNGVDRCLINDGITIRLGQQLYPVDLQLLAHAPDGSNQGTLTIGYQRQHPHTSTIEKTFDISTPAEVILSELYQHLVRHVPKV